jgi:hypothetical protein
MIMEMLALARRIQALASAGRPAEGFAFGIMLSQLSDQELDLMNTMEHRFGSMRCNRWMCSVLAGTTAFVRNGDLSLIRSPIRA